MGRNVATRQQGQGKCAGGASGPCLPDEHPQATFALSPPQHTITLLIELRTRRKLNSDKLFTLLSMEERKVLDQTFLWLFGQVQQIVVFHHEEFIEFLIIGYFEL